MKTLALLLLLSVSGAVAAPRSHNRTAQDRKPVERATARQIDRYTGVGEQRDLQQTGFCLDLIEQSHRDHAPVMLFTWIWHGKGQLYAMRQNRDGSWSGPNPPMGYYTSKVSSRQ